MISLPSGTRIWLVAGVTDNRDNLPLLYQTETFLKTLSDLLP